MILRCCRSHTSILSDSSGSRDIQKRTGQLQLTAIRRFHPNTRRGSSICFTAFFMMSVLVTKSKSLLVRTKLARTSGRMALLSSLDDLFEGLLRRNGEGALTTEAQLSSQANAGHGDWLQIDWANVVQEEQAQGNFPSPVEAILVRDRLLYLKRDDLLRLPGSQVSGNKARKMFSLCALPDDKFPQCLVSYGGPQSNAMLALAAAVHFRNQKAGIQADDPNRKRFVYYTKKLPRFLRSQPSGNLFRAQCLGMELCELSHNEYQRLFGGDWGGRTEPPPSLAAPVPTKSLWVPQGGASEIALAGTRRLAQEIIDYWIMVGKGRPLSVLVPGGTCSTALLVHRAMKDILEQGSGTSLDIQVVVVPCVGDECYAKRQMSLLNRALGFEMHGLPKVLHPTSDRDSHLPFGEPNRGVLDVWREMKDEHQIVLDLLYGAPSWAVLFRHWESGSSEGLGSPLQSRSIMYIHSGGLEGINSQLLRYKHKNLVDLDEVQLPGKQSFYDL